jgi:hypothetical protein
MTKIPAPKKAGDCVGFAGLTVCPHTVFLTAAQKKKVHSMHSANVSTLKTLKAKAKVASKRKSAGG